MHVRVLLSRYRSYTTCPACEGQRFKPDSLRFKLDPTGNGDRLTLSDFYRLPIRDAAGVINELADRLDLNRADALAPVLAEVRGRLDGRTQFRNKNFRAELRGRLELRTSASPELIRGAEHQRAVRSKAGND